MSLVARIAQPDGKTVLRLALNPKQAVRAKGVRNAKVEIIDEATNRVIPDVSVRRDGDTIELSVLRNGEKQVLILEDGDGAGISVSTEAGQVIDGGASVSASSGTSSAPGAASAPSSVWPGTFIVGDNVAAAGIPWLWPAALVGGAALLLNRDSNPDRTPPVVSGLDITTATDSGANDLATRSGTPSLTFSGEPGLNIALKGADGKLLDKSQYTVSYADGKYTVALLDANTGAAGAQAFGSFLNGLATGNAATVADGRYTIVATDTANNSIDVGSFTIDTTPPVTGPIDITAATDTGANDTTTRNGLPVLTFTGEEGLAITLKGANGDTLNPSQYSVRYVAGSTPGSGTYTVTLVDANTTAPDPQGFGTFTSTGAPTGNGPASADGVYTIVATDTASNSADVGKFTIDTTPPNTGLLDITPATDTGPNDSNTSNGLPILTFAGEPGLSITLKGVDGSLLDPAQYSVSYVPGAGAADGTYTVALLDANPSAAGAQGFGSFTNAGAASGNPAASVDGTYTIVATDSATNSKDVGTFAIDTTPPTTGALDITAATDTGADDNNTRNGLPVLSFTGEPGLAITLKGANGAALDPTQYSVNYANGAYTVALLDANLATAGAQGFGSYTGAGAPSGNPAVSADGLYTIVATDTAANSKDVGSFVIDTTPPVTGPLDISAATDTGADDANTRNSLPVLTFSGEPGLNITLKGANGTLLSATQYNVNYANGIYTVTLVDANTATDGAQGFGSFTGAGAATGNPAASADGTYTIVATDTAANAKDVGSFVIDTTAPVTGALDITTATDTGANDTNTGNSLPILTFSGEPGLAITLKGADGSLLAPSQYSVSYAPGVGGANGTYVVALLDADAGTGGAQGFGSFTSTGAASGNPASSLDGTYTIVATDSATNTKDVGTFTIDTTAPAAPTVTNVTENAGDPNAADLITNDNTQELSVTAAAGGTLKVYTQAGVLVPTSNYAVTETAAGVYTVNFNTNTLADGNYVVRVTDAAGNESLPSGALTIDTTAPAAPTITNVTENAGDPNPADLVTNDNTQVLTVTAAAGGTLKVYTQAGVLVPTSSYVVTETAAGVYSVNFNTNVLADGNYVVKVSDAAGNESGASGAFTVNTSAPVTSGLDIRSDTDTGANDFQTKNGNPVLTFNGEAGLAIDLLGSDGTTALVEGQQYSVVFSDPDGDGQGVYTVTLLDAQPGNAGIYDFGTASGNVNPTADGLYTLKARDAAGNSSTVGSFTIDTTAPAAPTVTNVTEPVSDPLPNDLITADNTQLLSVTAAAGGTLKVYTQAGVLVPTTNYVVTETSAGTYTVNFNTNILADGNYVVTVTDVAGNESAPSGPFTIDTTAPAAPTVTNVSENAGDPDTTDLLTNDNTQVLSVTADANSTLKVYTLAGALIPTTNYTVTEGPSGVYSVNFGTNTLEGSYVVKATDAAGNESNASGAFTVDTTPPAGSVAINALSTADTTPVITGTVTGMAAGEILLVTVGTGTYAVVPAAAGTWSLDLGDQAPISGTAPALVPGNYDVIASIMDPAGNKTSDTSYYELTITVPPPSDLAVVTVIYSNDYRYFREAGDPLTQRTGVSGGTILVQFSQNVRTGTSDTDPTAMSWDYDGASAVDAADSYNFVGNELTGQASGLPDRLLFTLNSGQNVQTKLESGDITAGVDPNNFAGAVSDVMDFAPGVAKTLIAGTNSVAANDIVVQYYWKTADTGGTFTGGSLGDKLVGGTGTDIFNGAAGNDTITGGAGSDQITLGAGADNLVLNSLLGSDTVLDFVVADDRIQLAKSVFTALGATGALTADQFVSGASVVVGADATDRIAYDTTTGRLFYDSDGSGAATPVLLATFTAAPLLTVTHFTVI